MTIKIILSVLILLVILGCAWLILALGASSEDKMKREMDKKYDRKNRPKSNAD